jgi:hypothetical protein
MLNAIRTRPPVAALTLDKTNLSTSWARIGMLFLSGFKYMAPLKTAFVIELPKLILEIMPLRMVSHTANTPPIIESRKALISPLQFRTDASVRVLTRP